MRTALPGLPVLEDEVMARHECDCGAVYSHPDQIVACAQNGHGSGCRGCAALRARVEEAEADRDELQATFDLQHAADMRAIEMFKAAHPDYPKDRWPDRAALFAWVAADRAEAEARVTRLVGLLREARDTLRRHRILLGGLGPLIDAEIGGGELMEPDPKWEAAMKNVVPSGCGRLDMSSYDAATELSQRFVYWEDTEERTEVRGLRCDHVAYMAARYPALQAEVERLRGALRNVATDELDGFGLCFCPHPGLGGHVDRCSRARAALSGPGDGEPRKCEVCGGDGSDHDGVQIHGSQLLCCPCWHKLRKAAAPPAEEPECTDCEGTGLPPR